MSSLRVEPSAAGYRTALGAVRILVGLTLLLHGYQKLFVYHISGVSGMMQQLQIPFPTLSAVLATAAEFGGGLFLLLGLFSRLAAIPTAFTMLVAIATAHWGKGFFAQGGGFEYPLLLLVTLLAVAYAGGGAFALDNVLWGKREPSLAEAHPSAA